MSLDFYNLGRYELRWSDRSREVAGILLSIMVQATINWLDGDRFLASASSGHALVIDSDRQRNSAPGPMELVLMGLCACAATDVVDILRKKREPLKALEVHAEAERAAQPPTVYTSVKLVFT